MEKSKKRVLNAAIVGSGTDDLTNMFLSLSLASIIADLAITKAQAGLISTITNIGMLAGGLLFGYLADRYGSLKLFK
ncbi:MAG: MFS transporter, partial [Trichococcus flocculiformis]